MKYLFIIAALSAVFSLHAENAKATITANVLNVRVKPSTKSDTIFQLKRGDEIIVVEKGDEWTAIRPPEKSSLYIYSPLIVDGKLKSNGYLRAGAGTNFQSLCLLPEGTPVTVLEDKNSWSRIAVPSVEVKCYIVTRYIKFPEAKAAAEKKSAPAALPVPKNKNDIVSFGTAKFNDLKKDYIKGTEKNVTVSGVLYKSENKIYGRTLALEVGKQYYHLAGVIPASIDITKKVKVSGVATVVNGWKYPILEIKNISQQ